MKRQGLDLVRALEERCFNAWPALRTVLADGWVLRLSDGHTKRANSASALHPSSLDVAALAGLVEETFGASGLRPLVRVTPLVDPAVARGLARRGWTEEDPTHAMFAAALPALDGEAGALLEPAASKDWIEGAMRAYGHGDAGAAALRRTLPLIVPPRAFATVFHDGRAAAWGLAVVERGMVGLYDLVVAPDARGAGLGRKLVLVLLSWGARQGAGAAYLQVRGSNTAALSLYRSLGFETAYDYSHLAAPISARR